MTYFSLLLCNLDEAVLLKAETPVRARGLNIYARQGATKIHLAKVCLSAKGGQHSFAEIRQCSRLTCRRRFTGTGQLFELIEVTSAATFITEDQLMNCEKLV